MVNIIQGSKGQITVRLYQGANGVIGDPIDLTGITEIESCFDNADGTELSLLETTGGIVILGSPLLGKIQLVFTSAQTALLAIVEHETLELKLTYAGDPQKILVKDAYAVVSSRC